MLGVETPGLYEASPPRRRSDSLKATEATAIAEAAAAAAVTAMAGEVQDARRTQMTPLAAAELAAEEDLDLDGEGGAGDGRERDNLLQIGAAAK